MTDRFVVLRMLDSLPLEHEQLEVSYTAPREKWSMVKLISVSVQEEDKLSRKRNQKAHFDYDYTKQEKQQEQ